VIHGGNGVNLILGGFGSDFIVTGEDASEAFGGPGNDFILGADANEQSVGNEGDDWLEQGNLDGSPGDNFDQLARDLIPGNDVYIGSGKIDIMNGEGGDDIMVGSSGPADKYLGASGFDWATFKDHEAGVDIDMGLRAFDAAPPPLQSAAAARFSGIEGLSGSAFGDLLRGDHENALTLPHIGAQGSVLTNVGLIDGLQEFLGAGVTSFGAGNIILGGSGSDVIEGRGGNDLIDGDKWLNVRISVRENADGTGAEIDTYDSMVPLVPLMLNGTYNPGQLRIQREILDGAPDFDTAIFSDVRANYEIVTDANGITTVTHRIIDPDDLTVTEGVDGSDRLTNVERLLFSDGAVVLVEGLNEEPVGLASLSDYSPRAGQTISASLANLSDPDNPGGAIVGPVAYFWQVELDPGTGLFTDLQPEEGDIEGRTIGQTL